MGDGSQNVTNPAPLYRIDMRLRVALWLELGRTPIEVDS
jgi:hypothetical protein